MRAKSGVAVILVAVLHVLSWTEAEAGVPAWRSELGAQAGSPNMFGNLRQKLSDHLWQRRLEALQGRGDPLAADKRQIGEEYEGFRLKKRPLPRREELQESFRLKKSDPTKEDHDGFRLKKIPDDSKLSEDDDDDTLAVDVEELVEPKRATSGDEDVEGFRLRRRDDDQDGFRLRKRNQQQQQDASRQAGSNDAKFFKMRQRNLVNSVNDVPNVFRLGK